MVGMNDQISKQQLCAIVPAFMEERYIAEVVTSLASYVGEVIVVDDGSTDRTASSAQSAGATVLRHDINSGKGAAVNTGLSHAAAGGYELAIVLDADGQHLASDIPGFLHVYTHSQAQIIVGNRMASTEGMPIVRMLTNRFMSWLLSQRMGQRVPDTQCGFRLYETDSLPFSELASGRFAAESEILLLAADRGLTIGAAPIETVYRDEKSKINPAKDAWRFFRMLRKYRKAQGTTG
jgi:glycosyltransferase involved in cell wall biosynthesis